jgi:hypothetical protein
MSQHNWVKEKQRTKEVKGIKATDQCSNVQPDNFIAFPSLAHGNFITFYNGVISASIMSRILPIIGLLMTSFLSPNFCGLWKDF